MMSKQEEKLLTIEEAMEIIDEYEEVSPRIAARIRQMHAEQQRLESCNSIDPLRIPFALLETLLFGVVSGILMVKMGVNISINMARIYVKRLQLRYLEWRVRNNDEKLLELRDGKENSEGE